MDRFHNVPFIATLPSASKISSNDGLNVCRYFFGDIQFWETAGRVQLANEFGDRNFILAGSFDTPAPVPELHSRLVYADNFVQLKSHCYLEQF